MEKPKLPEKATDLEQVLFLIGHIKRPCRDLQGNSLRNFYIQEATKTLSTIKEPSAQELLADVIEKYKSKNN